MSDAILSHDDGNTVQSDVAMNATEAETVPWKAIEQDSDFRHLVGEKRNFIIPATIFFLLFYFVFLIVVGYFPDVANTDVIGHINVAYLFALAQFIMTWVLMYLYVRRADGFDRLVQQIMGKIRGGKSVE